MKFLLLIQTCAVMLLPDAQFCSRPPKIPHMKVESCRCEYKPEFGEKFNLCIQCVTYKKPAGISMETCEKQAANYKKDMQTPQAVTELAASLKVVKSLECVKNDLKL